MELGFQIENLQKNSDAIECPLVAVEAELEVETRLDLLRFVLEVDLSELEVEVVVVWCCYVGNWQS